jgi:hypothetical protein
MKLFWKINLYINILVFILFLTYFLVVKFSFIKASVSNICMSLTFLFFNYGVFLEIFQIPLCIIALFFKNKPKRVKFLFFMMFIFFIIKMILFIYLLGSGL